MEETQSETVMQREKPKKKNAGDRDVREESGIRSATTKVCYFFRFSP